jgi:hypothetical protein
VDGHRGGGGRRAWRSRLQGAPPAPRCLAEGFDWNARAAAPAIREMLRLDGREQAYFLLVQAHIKARRADAVRPPPPAPTLTPTPEPALEPAVAPEAQLAPPPAAPTPALARFLRAAKSCRYGARCSRPGCSFAHPPAPALVTGDGQTSGAAGVEGKDKGKGGVGGLRCAGCGLAAKMGYSKSQARRRSSRSPRHRRLSRSSMEGPALCAWVSVRRGDPAAANQLAKGEARRCPGCLAAPIASPPPAAGQGGGTGVGGGKPRRGCRAGKARATGEGAAPTEQQLGRPGMQLPVVRRLRHPRAPGVFDAACGQLQ